MADVMVHDEHVREGAACSPCCTPQQLYDLDLAGEVLAR